MVTTLLKTQEAPRLMGRMIQQEKIDLETGKWSLPIAAKKSMRKGSRK